MLDIQNGANWKSVFFSLVSGRMGGKDTVQSYRSFSSPILKINVSCLKCSASWHKAGHLTQLIPQNTGRFLISSSRKIVLNQEQVIFYPQIATKYFVRFQSVPWLLNNSQLRIYEYIGPPPEEKDFNQILIT